MGCPTCGKSLNTEQGVRQHHTKVHDEPLPNRVCNECNSEFYDPQSRRKYCETCYSEAGESNGNWRGGKERGTCQNCDAEIHYYPSNKKGIYCDDCLENAKGLLPTNPSQGVARISLECGNCGDLLSRLPSAITDNSYGVFCDAECYGTWLSENIHGEQHHQWEGGTIPYGAGWWDIRRKALSRDDYRCQRCGTSKSELGQNPDVHHIIPVREFESAEMAHTLSNVICLCRTCHRLVESGAVKEPAVYLKE